MSSYNPVNIGLLYVAVRNKYFSKYNSIHFKTQDFRDLSLLLEKEKTDPQKFFDYVFGMCDYQRPLSPKSLCNPVLIMEFKQKVR
jgi:hypothetical protein